MEINKSFIGKTLYAVLFCVILPLILIWWSLLLQVTITIPPLFDHTGLYFITAGAALMLEAMWQLWKNGKGLPMNAYPPGFYVTTGSYKWVAHPIYTGFCLLCVGMSVLFKSSAGFYVISPTMVLLSIALVVGYEKWDLKRRFPGHQHVSLFNLSDKHHTSTAERLLIFALAFLPWIVLYEIVLHIGISDIGLNSLTSVEKSWPVFDIAEIPYAFTYFYVMASPFLIRENKQAKQFLLNAWWITAVGIFIQFTLPMYSEHRPFVAETFLGRLIMLERSYDGEAAALPSFHVLWALLATMVWKEKFPSGRYLWWTISLLIIISCSATGIHSIADIAVAIALFIFIIKRKRLWIFLQDQSERLANSWRAQYFGKLRVINHSIYAGLAAMAGILICYQFQVDNVTILSVTSFSLAGGAVWGQVIEGSSRLLRPFGYYGALIGGVLGLFILHFVHHAPLFNTWAAFVIAAPVAQAIGRLRCLIQGCCHGIVEEDGMGIRYYNEHTRVCQISGLKGKSIHNTQLYSIIGNILIGMILLRLALEQASPTLLIGVYFILSGVERFIEEAYRGEVQTNIIKGLRFYQWTAIASVVAGIFISSIPTSQQLIFVPSVDLHILATTVFCGLAWAFAMGMDFPTSHFRFSRLSG